MVRHQLDELVLVGSIPTPNFCEQLIKIRGWYEPTSRHHLPSCVFESPSPNQGGIFYAKKA